MYYLFQIIVIFYYSKICVGNNSIRLIKHIDIPTSDSTCLSFILLLQRNKKALHNVDLEVFVRSNSNGRENVFVKSEIKIISTSNNLKLLTKIIGRIQF